jgi:3-hydroxyacyl-[acyl-carrier-protein] dehydratase
MRFHLVDRIVAFDAGKNIQAVKNLTLGEEYLADHFPTFPVMPGVLMLEALVEAGAWLLRLSEDYRHSVIVLHEARNVKYGMFMEPGRQMNIAIELIERNGALATLKGKGAMDGQQTVSARLTLRCSNLADRDPALKAVDERIVSDLRDRHRVLCGGFAEKASVEKVNV